MPKFLIEVPHENKKQSCDQAVAIFKQTGSHFLTNADWGCSDNVHKAWIIIDLDKKAHAQKIIPPWFRDKSTVITLHKFALENIDESKKQHKA